MKKKVIATLESGENGEEKPYDYLAFYMRTKNVEVSAALSAILTEWYEWYTLSKDFAYKGMVDTFRARTIDQMNQQSDSEYPDVDVNNRPPMVVPGFGKKKPGDNDGDK